MQGSVGLKSKPGKGTVFWIEIPFKKSKSENENADPLASIAQMRCLVLARNLALGKTIASTLVSRDVDVHVTNTDAATLKAVEQSRETGRPFDAIILERDNDTERQLCWFLELQKSTRGQPVPIILLSEVGVENISALLLANIAARLTKPIRHSRLLEMLRRLRTGEPMQDQRSQKESEDRQETIPGFRILLAEDNPVNTDLAQRQFRKLGYEIDCVTNGLEVINEVETKEYDVIFMDCQMPEMDGYTATRLIRQFESLKGSRTTFIIAMTANALVGDRERCIEAGMDDYLSKPVRLNELKAIIRRAAAQRPLIPDQSPAAPPTLSPPAPVATLEEDLPTLDDDIIEGLKSLEEDDNSNALEEMSELFIADTVNRLQKLEESFHTKDHKALMASAHAIKGSSGNFGARRMARFCLQIEEAVNADEPDTIAACLAALKNEFEEVKRQLAKHTLKN